MVSRPNKGWRYTEQALQRAVWGHIQQRGVPGLFAWHHPAGGFRSPVEAAIFKGIGTRAGLPDLFMLHRGKLYGLELKTPDGKVSDAQKQAMADLAFAGATVAVAFSLDEALGQLEGWNLLRGTAARAA